MKQIKWQHTVEHKPYSMLSDWVPFSVHPKIEHAQQAVIVAHLALQRHHNLTQNQALEYFRIVSTPILTEEQ